jgi:hypothetical protein
VRLAIKKQMHLPATVRQDMAHSIQPIAVVSHGTPLTWIRLPCPVNAIMVEITRANEEDRVELGENEVRATWHLLVLKSVSVAHAVEQAANYQLAFGPANDDPTAPGPAVGQAILPDIEA